MDVPVSPDEREEPGERPEPRERHEPGDPAGRAERVKARARALGFGPVGVTHPLPSGHLPFYEEWLDGGLHGEMRYLERADAVRRRGDLRRTMEGVRSVLVVAHPYFTGDAPGVPDDPSVGVIARYARGRDYHKVVKRKLLELLRWMREDAGWSVEGRAYVDTGPILERELAQRAGLGWFGRNTMLIDPRLGSYFFLGCLLLDLELEADEPSERDHCGTCSACLEACPTGALLGRDEDGAPVIDATRCISYLTIEHRGPIPVELREAIGNRVYGCDICQEVCPFNVRFAEETEEPAYAARGPGELPSGVEADPTASSAWHPGTESPSMVELFRMALDAESWESFSRGSAIRRAGREGFARNVAVALGNWGDRSAVPMLSQGLKDPHPLVRAHAGWALGRVGSPEALTALGVALEDEESASVREEIERALDDASSSWT